MDTSTVAPRLWTRPLMALGLFFAAAFSPLLAMAPLAAVTSVKEWINDPGHLVAGTTVAVLVRLLPVIVAVLGVRWLMRRFDRRPIQAAGLVWTRDSARLLLAGVAVSVVALVPVALALQSGARPLEANTSPWWSIVAIGFANAVLVQGFPEELIFRGYLMQALRHRPLVALTTSTIVFGALHLLSQGGQQNTLERVLYLATPTAFGFCAAALLLLTRSLWPALGIHGGLHLTTMTLGFAGRSTESPAMWVGSAAVYAVIGAVALLLWRRQGRSGDVVIDR